MNPPDDLAISCLDTLLAATAEGDYERFVSVGDERFRGGIGPEMFRRVSRSLGPRMRKGFTPTFLGELRQGGSVVSLWRLGFADGGDDRLVRMSLASGRVRGALVTPAFP